jgi:hypothetical protein
MDISKQIAVEAVMTDVIHEPHAYTIHRRGLLIWLERFLKEVGIDQSRIKFST